MTGMTGVPKPILKEKNVFPMSYKQALQEVLFRGDISSFYIFAGKIVCGMGGFK